jgi:hypothetical protein
MSESMYDRAFPLIQEALDGFVDFDLLRIGFSDSGVRVMATSQAALDTAAPLLERVFGRAGWGFRNRIRRGSRDVLVFTPPEQPMPRPNLRVVR